MSKLTVEDTSLVSVANAIRTKGGTTEALTFPDGFVSAIEGIQSGGGENYLVGYAEGTIKNITANMLKGCTKIGDNAFYYSFINSIVIPEGVTSIGSGAFRSSRLKSIVIPNSVTSIKLNAFRECVLLPSIVIPEGVTSIKNYAFEACSKLTSIEMKCTTPPTIGTYTLNTSSLNQIVVPAGTLSAYQSATNWSAYADKMVEASS